MACYDPVVGDFYNTTTFQPAPSAGSGANQWAFRRTGSNYELLRNNVSVFSTSVPSGATQHAQFFPNNQFAAILFIGSPSGGFTSYQLQILDLRGATVVSRSVAGPFSGSGTPQFHLFPSPDGLAFFIWIGEGNNTSHSHQVLRSDTATALVSWGTIFNEVAQRMARITPGAAGKIVEIYTTPAPNGARIWASAALPRGTCAVSPRPADFGETVVGGPAALASAERDVTIRNTGGNCLNLDQPANQGPFSFVSSTRPFPVSLDPGQDVSVRYRFAPATVGNFSETIPLVPTPPGDTSLLLTGRARAPVPRLTVGGTLAFGSLPVGSTAMRSLTLTNTGEVPLTVNLAAPPAGSPYAWTPLNGAALGVGASMPVNVTFAPTSEGNFPLTLTFTTTPGTGTHNVNATGHGCVPNAEIEVPPVSAIGFGPIQRGFRGVRLLRIRNPGDGPLAFNARITGADAGTLFNLGTSPGAITNVADRITPVTVNPVSTCGPGATGPGFIDLPIVFFANDAPRPASANLVLDMSNATNVAPGTTWTFPLSAEIIEPTAVDVGLVLDRSGSMSDAAGSRTKADAAVAGGRLFAQLSRPDADDRITVVRFDHEPNVLQPITAITSGNHQSIVDTINATSLAPRGATAIASGVMTAIRQLEAPRTTMPTTLHRAVVVLTDGMDNTAYQDPTDGQWYTLDGSTVVDSSGTVQTSRRIPTTGLKIYSVGLGDPALVDSARLTALSNVSGGYFNAVRDLSGGDFFALEKFFAQVYMDTVGMAAVQDPLFRILPGETQTMEFDVLPADVGATVIVFDMQGMRLPFMLVSPRGEIFDGARLPPGFQQRIGATETARFVELVFPVNDPSRFAGRWGVVVKHDGRACPGAPDPRKAHPGFRGEGDCKDWKREITYGISIGVGSNFRLQPYLSAGPLSVGDLIRMTGVVTEAGVRIQGADVRVDVVSPTGHAWSYRLHDDGAHDDADPQDGEYANTFAHTHETGWYRFTFRAEGRSEGLHPARREAVLTRYVGAPGETPTPGNPGGGHEDDCCKRMLALLERCCAQMPKPKPTKPVKLPPRLDILEPRHLFADHDLVLARSLKADLGLKDTPKPKGTAPKTKSRKKSTSASKGKRAR